MDTAARSETIVCNNVFIDGDLKEKVEFKAEQLGLSVSETVVLLIERGLDD